MRAEVNGYSSDSGWIEQNSVNTTPQPPSAFMPRRCAWAPGRSAPGPAQCVVCQKRLRVAFGPILTDSNNTLYLGSRGMFLVPGEAGPTTGERCDDSCGKNGAGHG